MPGIYASAMQNTVVQGRWPPKMLTIALYYNTLSGNNHGLGLNDVNDQMLNNPGAHASCHPNAIMFMNIVSTAVPALFANDDVFGLGDGKRDGAAALDVAAGQLALTQDYKAIWVKYGLHSFTLMTGAAGERVESFEAWAGHPIGYFFHRSVFEEPDDLGYPRVADSRPTRAEASAALGD